MKTFRAESLDALRGVTIGMMVLCGSIVSRVLPNWMSHCQVPPGHGFDPSIYGITWVDLVFPFFLFSMGAAMPFSVGSRMDRGAGKLRVSIDGLWRGVKLIFFAIFIQNCYPWTLANVFGREQDAGIWCFTLAAFMVLFLLFSRWPGHQSRMMRYGVPAVGFVIACAMMGYVESHVALSPEYVSTHSAPDIFFKHVHNILGKSNIIILLLGYMAAFGTVIYVATIGKPLARVALLPLLMGILLGGGTEGTWQASVFHWTPDASLFEFRYLKYLFIIIPGTIAGEQLRRWILEGGTGSAPAPTLSAARRDFSTGVVALLSLAIIVVNVWLLYTRQLTLNLWLTLAMLWLIRGFARRLPANLGVIAPLVKFGSYLLVLGLFFEAFEGGIRKDDSTYSYYFVTSGLASMALAFLVIICDVYRWRAVTAPFSLAGKNPMIAYVATSMFFGPVMALCGIREEFLHFCEQNRVSGLLHGVVFTTLSLGLAACFSKVKLYWRT